MPNVVGFEGPFVVAAVFMTIAAIMQVRSTSDRVPNWLTLGALIAAIVAGVATAESVAVVGTILFCAACGLSVLMVPYSHGHLGAGCVKAQAAFGAWVGVGMSVRTADNAWLLVLVATVASYMLTFAAYWVTLRVIAAEQQDSEETYWFPAQLTLSLGSVLALFVDLSLRQ